MHHPFSPCVLFFRAMNPVVRSDIVVSNFLDSVGGYKHKERRDKLLDILDVDLDWHMHAISDGERRRIQLCMGLMAPWDVLLLDEVRSSSFMHGYEVGSVTRFCRSLLTLMSWFVTSCLHSFETIASPVELPSSVSYNSLILLHYLNIHTDATHIFDGLGSFPTHIAHMRFGSFVQEPTSWPSGFVDGHQAPTLYNTALQWLKEDRDYRRILETQGRKGRGARNEVCFDSCSSNYIITHPWNSRPSLRIPRRSIRSGCDSLTNV